MAKKNHETHPDCDHCEHRHSSPLCSVPEAMAEVQSHRTAVHFKAGQTIFYQGNDPIGLYVVQEGLVKLEVVDSEGHTNTLRLLAQGQALGYRALFAKEPYRASAVAVEDCTLCFLPKVTLFGIVCHHNQVAMNLLEQLSKDLKTAEEKWVTQVNKGAPERVAEALLFLEDHFQDQPWTRREIAQWAGTTPETVMRTLAQFEKEGLVHPQGKRYQILNRQKLSEKASVT